MIGAIESQLGQKRIDMMKAIRQGVAGNISQLGFLAPAAAAKKSQLPNTQPPRFFC